MSAHSRASPHRYSIDTGSLCYRTDAADTSRIGIPQDEELNYRLIYEDHDIARSGHLGREKTYSLVIQINWWNKYINWYALMFLPVRSASDSNPRRIGLRSWLVSLTLWVLESISMYFVFGLPKYLSATRVLWFL